MLLLQCLICTKNWNAYIYCRLRWKAVGVRYTQRLLFSLWGSLCSRTSTARTPLEPWNYFRDRRSSSLWVLIIAQGQEAYRDTFSIIFNMKVCCVFSIESPNENTQYTIINLKKENHPKWYSICCQVIFSKGLKTEFETAVVNEPLVFEPLKFYCLLNTALQACKNMKGILTFLETETKSGLSMCKHIDVYTWRSFLWFF